MYESIMNGFTELTGLTRVCVGYLVFVIMFYILVGLEEAYKRGER
jgi:hypothetical protein